MKKSTVLSELKLRIGKLVHADYRHYICLALTVAFALLSVFVFRSAFTRVLEALRDFGTSMTFYACEVFGLELDTYPTVIEFSSVPLSTMLNLPGDFEGFKVVWSAYWKAFISPDFISAYFVSLGNFLFYASRFLVLILPIIVVFVVLSNRNTKTNNDYNQDTKALKRFKHLEKRFILPIFYWCRDFISFVGKNSVYLKIWALIWAYNFNIITIVLETISYYFFFIASFNVVSLYIQVLKLLMDLSVMVTFLPGIVWLLIGLFVFDRVRRNIGYKLLSHMENCDRGFINERPIVLMVCGTMGKKKTTMITDIALSQEIMFRDKAYEKILECDLKFPNFPWIIFENQLKSAMEHHSVYSLATARRFVRLKRLRFFRRSISKNIFTYDYARYGYEYNDGLKVVDIWEVLEVYAQLYYIYIIQSSLLISNYSIRTDNILDDIGNFPLWNTDLFKRDSRMNEAYSRHAHILDFDSLRLGKKVLEENERADSFEFGVINITEIGKERGNNLELQQVKKNDESTNQKNDLFNSWLKMVRHSATVDNFPFVKVITDEQRPESWGADARDLCEIVYIDKCSEIKMAMPCIALEELITDFILAKFRDRYRKHRYLRGDNTLTMYLFHRFISLLQTHKLRLYNTFGYFKLNINVEAGTQDSELKHSIYYLMCKKIYSKRFSTDCFSEFFNEKALRSRIGINDLEEFKSERASFEEMLSENSYFFNDLTKLK